MLSPPLDLDHTAALASGTWAELTRPVLSLGRVDSGKGHCFRLIWYVSAHCFVLPPSPQEDGVFQPQNEYM